jgi:glycosyltransferase involved in cell wall biosynthesis
VFIQNDDVAKLIANADIFVFASSCETFGIALLEAMTIGLPIACSNRSSLPETLQDGGEYFDPQNPESISMAIDRLIQNADRRSAIAGRAKALALGYSWSQCAQDTWEFMVKTYFEVKFEGAA